MDIIDAFPHILPKPLFEGMVAAAETPSARSWLNGSSRQTGLYELDVRFRMMDARPGYQQILTLGTPPLEQVASGATLRDLATLANDSMAELCHRYPDRFLGFAAGLPMGDPDASVKELERAINQLGARGVQIFTNVNGHPLDEPRFEPLFAKFSELNKPIWVHGARSFIYPEFASEEESRYGLWLALGWPYEMGLFMARVVLAGILDRYPNLRFLTHHGGGMIPTFGQRVASSPIGFQGPEHAPEVDTFSALEKSPVEYFKMFYADTTVGGEARTIRASLDFFGSDQVLFASDWPFGPPTDDGQIGPTLSAIDRLGLSEAEHAK
ncbi:MAG: amidohydrolase, partial [Chloroflexi bacterium]|nr:amidohydrolase [Chloroflexota bacterium]